MADKTARKLYAKPILQKRQRLTELAEGANIMVSGTFTKGGCFSNNR